MRNFLRNPMNWLLVFIPAALVVDYLVKASLIGGILGNLLFALARKNQLDLTVGIAVGSSQQIALFVAPVLVLLSYAVAPKPMNLGFGNSGLAIIFLAVLITGMIASDGKSNWFKGVQLPCVYALIARCCYFLPDNLEG